MPLHSRSARVCQPTPRTSLNPSESTALWQALARGDTAARDALLAAHLTLVHHVARKLSRSLAAPAEFDELVSCGIIGLLGALNAFDVSRGLAFSTFAVPRIRGAILDELRRQDHVPRSIRRKTRAIATARETLTRNLGRSASDQEVAEHLGIDVETLWRWQADAEGAVHLPLEHATFDRDGNPQQTFDPLTNDSDTPVDEEISRHQEYEILRNSLSRLKEQERVVLTLYYFEELKLHEIADVLQLTESRVSQIRAKALGRLRVELAGFHQRVA
jgi:RNA polymerase sigma factor for flagellar operon FliA